MRPTLSSRGHSFPILFIAEIYSNPLIEPHARTVGQMYLADSCKLTLLQQRRSLVARDQVAGHRAATSAGRRLERRIC